MPQKEGKRRLTCKGEQLVANEDGTVVLVLVQGVCPPLAQELLHSHNSGYRSSLTHQHLYAN